MKPETAKKIKELLDKLPREKRKATLLLGLKVAREYTELIKRVKNGSPRDGGPKQTDKPA